MQLPDLSAYRPHRVIDDVDLEGTVVPGLRASFLRRRYRGRIRTVGVYAYRGAPVFMAGGYVGEEHCRWTAYADPERGWSPPRPGCPRISRSRAGLVLRTHQGELVLPTVDRHRPPPAACAADSGSDGPELAGPVSVAPRPAPEPAAGWPDARTTARPRSG